MAKKKWGKIGAPGSKKRKAHLAKIRVCKKTPKKKVWSHTKWKAK